MDATQALGMMAAIAVQAVALALMCITMRRKNGFRGVHELLSSTYVSQPARTDGALELSHLPIAYSVVEPSLPDFIAGYKIAGRLGKTESVEVFDAFDESLGRRVWLYTSRDSKAIQLPLSRTSSVRTTRPRWLQNGVNGDLHWFAVEAVNGVPLSHMESLPWDLSLIHI